MNKVLVRQYITFGKGDGEQLVDEYVVKDSQENRQDILDEFGGYYYALDNEESFLNGDIDYFEVELDGGDWDDPTGKALELHSKEEILEEITDKYESEVRKINKLFGEC